MQHELRDDVSQHCLSLYKTAALPALTRITSTECSSENSEHLVTHYIRNMPLEGGWPPVRLESPHGDTLTSSVSPVPFPNQQLPGFPKFAPPQIEGLGTDGSSPGSGHGYAPSGPGGLRGPESVAANTLISPVPGGIAGRWAS